MVAAVLPLAINGPGSVAVWAGKANVAAGGDCAVNGCRFVNL